MEGKIVSQTMLRIAEKDSLSAHDLVELEKDLGFFDEAVDGLGFCFSKEGDLLSQWRGYAADGTGVAIGFSRGYLLEQCGTLTNSNNELAFSLGEVAYELDEHENLVKEVYEKIKPYINEGAFRPHMATLLTLGDPEFEQKRLAVKTLRKNLNDELLSLIGLLFRLKGPAFKEESEVRLFSYFLKIGAETCDYRAVQDRIIPYRRFNLSLEDSPIAKVILGPKHATPPWTVQRFLQNYGYGDVMISRSSASYR